MNEISLDVARAYPADIGRAFARVGLESFLELQLDPGSIIALDGEYTTAAKVWRADRVDWNTNTVRLDPVTRRNAGVTIGDSLSVRRVAPTPAETVWASPVGVAADFDVDAEAVERLSRQLLKQPVAPGDFVSVHVGRTSQVPPTGSSDPALLVIEDTDPDGIGVITDATALQLDNHTRPLQPNP